MKKLFYVATLALLVSVFYSCGEKTSSEKPVKNTFEVKQNDFQGEIPAGDKITLEAKTYKLTGKLIVKAGAELTIPAGAVIEATVNSDMTKVRYIAVERGAKIFVNGTSDKPVVMTSESKKSSSWGGLVICGYAPTNKGGGQAKAEVSDLNYGGDKVDDSSGSIRHLRVEYTGFKYTDEKEFNGVSLFGVGRGTTFEYVTSYKGGDDGIEFFGGTVNGKYLLSIDSEDDGIDFADGWNGTGENWFVRNAFKSSIEGSNNGDNGDAAPLTDAKLKNLTLIGSGEKPWYFKEGAGKQTIDNLIIGGLKAGKNQAYFYADAKDKDAATYKRLAAGDLKITNVKFVDLGEGNTKMVFDPALKYTENEKATGAGNGVNRPSWVSDAMNATSNGSKIF